jgi:polysaccharide biosynthesis transport protein
MTIAPSRPTNPPGAAAPPPTRPRALAAAAGPSIDPFRVLRRHLLLLVAATNFGLGVGVAVFLTLDRMYPLFTGEVLFRLKPGLADPSQIGASDIQTEEQVVRMAKTESFLLLGRPVIESALLRSGIQQTQWSGRFRDETGQFVVQDAVDDLVEALDASPVRSTNLLRLAWSTHNQSDIPVVLNAIAETYISQRENRENDAYNADEKTFKDQLTLVDREILDTSTAIQTFIQQNGLVTTTAPQFSQANAAVVAIGEEINRNRADLNAAQTRAQQTKLKVDGKLEASEEDRLQARSDPRVQMVERAISDYRMELDQLKKKYGPTHPEVMRSEERVRAGEAEFDRTYNESLQTMMFARYKEFASLVEQLERVVKEQEEDYLKKLEKLTQLTANISAYESLETRRARLEEQRSDLNKLLSEIRLLQVRSEADRVVIAQPAIIPREKSFPSWKVVIPLCGLLFFALTVGAVFVRELTDQRVKSAADLTLVSGAKVLGVIPDLEDDPTRVRRAELVVRDAPGSVLAESYRQASAVISNAIEHNGYQSVLVVGGLPGSGSSTVITNLAAAQAAAGRRVLVLEANFRRPSLGASFGVKPDAPGLGDLLVGSVTLEQAVADVGSGVHFIGAGTPANRVFERLGAGRFEGLRAQIAERYDLILIDAPPVVVAGDALVLANRVDASVLVVRAGQEQRGLVARLITQLHSMRSEFLGAVLNRPRGTVGGYYKKNFATMASYSKA